MGNICNILSGKSRQVNDDIVIARPIPVATPLFDYDISNNPQYSNLQYSNPQYSYPQYIQQDAYYGVPVYQNPRQSVVVVQQPGIIYNDPASSAMTGFLGGMLIGEMLDGDCY
jgi:hypothetical protein